MGVGCSLSPGRGLGGGGGGRVSGHRVSGLEYAPKAQVELREGFLVTVVGPGVEAAAP